MGLQKYRADYSEKQADGSVRWFTKWLGGPSLAKIENCQIHQSDIRRTVYITGEPDTYFSQPAACRMKGKTAKGYITGDDSGALIFHPMDSAKHLFI